MPTVDVECPECASTIQVEEEQLGKTMKCPKCKSVFEAEKAEGAYELADPPPRPKSRQRSSDGPSPEADDEGDEESIDELRKRMERWADES
jgi:predicted Zn finger-like uncharacterized protein